MDKPEITQEMDKKLTPQQEIQQHLHDLNQWFEERGLSIVVVAVGKRTGKPSDIDDFLPETHIASVQIVPKGL